MRRFFDWVFYVWGPSLCLNPTLGGGGQGKTGRMAGGMRSGVTRVLPLGISRVRRCSAARCISLLFAVSRGLGSVAGVRWGPSISVGGQVQPALGGDGSCDRRQLARSMACETEWSFGSGLYLRTSSRSRGSEHLCDRDVRCGT